MKKNVDVVLRLDIKGDLCLIYSNFWGLPDPYSLCNDILHNWLKKTAAAAFLIHWVNRHLLSMAETVILTVGWETFKSKMTECLWPVKRAFADILCMGIYNSSRCYTFLLTWLQFVVCSLLLFAGIWLSKQGCITYKKGSTM